MRRFSCQHGHMLENEAGTYCLYGEVMTALCILRSNEQRTQDAWNTCQGMRAKIKQLQSELSDEREEVELKTVRIHGMDEQGKKMQAEIERLRATSDRRLEEIRRQDREIGQWKRLVSDQKSEWVDQA